MPIEFHCRRCGKLLQTPDEAAGKQAKCPECEEVQPIPAGPVPTEPVETGVPPTGPVPSEPTPPPTPEDIPPEPFGRPADPAATARGNPFGAPPVLPPGSSEIPTNPFQSPGDYTTSGPVPEGGTGEYKPSIIDLGDCFSRAWAIFADQWGMCLATWVIGGVMSFAFGMLIGAISGVISAAAGLDEVAAFCLQSGLNFVNYVFSFWVSLGQMIIFLQIARGQPAELGLLFSGGRFLVRYTFMWILFAVAVGFGLALLIVPGIIFALMFWEAGYLIVDRDLGTIDSLSESSRITNGNKMTLLAIGIVWVALSVAGTLFTCGLGMFVIGPYGFVLATVIYLRMTGQRIVMPR